MGLREILINFSSLLKEMEKAKGVSRVFIYDTLKCSACGKEMLVRGVRGFIREKKHMKVMEIYKGKCKKCGNEVRQKMVMDYKEWEEKRKELI